MKKLFLITLNILLYAFSVNAQDDPRLTEVWNPVPGVVTPGKTVTDAPSDAIVLFNGKDFSN